MIIVSSSYQVELHVLELEMVFIYSAVPVALGSLTITLIQYRKSGKFRC